MFGRRFKPTDVAQQIVGGFLLAGPFVVTEEVWDLASSMNALQTAIVVFIPFAIGYGALYEADDDRDPDREGEIAGVPARFVTLMFTAYGSVALLALSFSAPETFGKTAIESAKAISIGAVFSVVGAATADSVF